MRLKELQEIWDKMALELEEQGHLVKREDWQEDSATSTQTPQNTTDSKTTKDGIDIGVIFTQGRNQKTEE